MMASRAPHSKALTNYQVNGFNNNSDMELFLRYMAADIEKGIIHFSEPPFDSSNVEGNLNYLQQYRPDLWILKSFVDQWNSRGRLSPKQMEVLNALVNEHKDTKAALERAPPSAFVASLREQFIQRGSLSKKQLDKINKSF